MKDPFTENEMVLHVEERTLSFRGEKFVYLHQCYLSKDTGEMFTTAEQDSVNIGQVYNKYRVKYGIPFPDEIKELRTKYGLSARKMSQILGFGTNQYRLYEGGDMPSEANGKILASIKNAVVFKVFVENAKNQLSEAEYTKAIKKIDEIAGDKRNEYRDTLIFNHLGRSEYNGFSRTVYDKLRSVVLYLLSICGDTYVTKMNKLLFYADFMSYKQRGIGITGLEYKAIQHGPVPVRWDRVYSLLDGVETEERYLPSGGCGYILTSSNEPDMSHISETDRDILDEVISLYGRLSAREISEISHKEEAWAKYYKTSLPIPYSEAFYLKE